MRRSNYPLIKAFVALLVVASFYTGWAFAKYSELPGQIPDDTDDTTISGIIQDEIPKAQLKKLSAIWRTLQIDYVSREKLDLKKLLDGAVKGFVDGLEDPYTVYMTSDESFEFQQSLNGELEGIGALLEMKDEKLTIVTPLKDSPAEKAGLKPGDIIIAIDGNDADSMTLYDAVSKIRGPEGSVVKLTIIHQDGKNPLEVSIQRGKIELESVSLEKKENGIYLITINSFSDSTQDEFSQAINEILLGEPIGIVMDLRFNGGGYLDISIEMLAEFLPDRSPAVRIKKRNSGDNEIMYTSGTPRLPDVPLVVLINEGSASASEIVAGALQDHKRAIIMGTQSFGKGSVQEIEKYADGSSLRMTVAKWFTPEDRTIDEVGITPDKVIEFTEEDIKAKRDPQLESAMNYLRGL